MVQPLKGCHRCSERVRCVQGRPPGSRGHIYLLAFWPPTRRAFSFVRRSLALGLLFFPRWHPSQVVFGDSHARIYPRPPTIATTTSAIRWSASSGTGVESQPKDAPSHRLSCRSSCRAFEQQTTPTHSGRDCSRRCLSARSCNGYRLVQRHHRVGRGETSYGWDGKERDERRAEQGETERERQWPDWTGCGVTRRGAGETSRNGTGQGMAGRHGMDGA